MRVAVVHNAVGPEAGPDERDVLVQAEHVTAALVRRGHHVEAVACDLDLAALARRLEELSPDVVFNLVESLGGHDRLIHVVPSLLDAAGLPYTGAPTEAVFVTTSKLLTKERLSAAALPVPAVLAVYPEAGYAAQAASPPPRAILKSVWDHGSPALDDEAVVAAASPAALRARLRAMLPRLSGAGFAEAFVEGREFNVSLLASPEGLVVLPPAEIEFVGYPAGKPRIVGRDAKWAPDSFEYGHTPRRFDFPPEDELLLRELGRLARGAWRRLRLAGYARVDFRVDGAGKPWILEVNVNPCLSPDAGFAAALEEAGVGYDEAIARILDDALARAGGKRPGPRPVMAVS